MVPLTLFDDDDDDHGQMGIDSSAMLLPPLLLTMDRDSAPSALTSSCAHFVDA